MMSPRWQDPVLYAIYVLENAGDDLIAAQLTAEAGMENSVTEQEVFYWRDVLDALTARRNQA